MFTGMYQRFPFRYGPRCVFGFLAGLLCLAGFLCLQYAMLGQVEQFYYWSYAWQSSTPGLDGPHILGWVFGKNLPERKMPRPILYGYCEYQHPYPLGVGDFPINASHCVRPEPLTATDYTRWLWLNIYQRTTYWPMVRRAVWTGLALTLLFTVYGLVKDLQYRRSLIQGRQIDGRRYTPIATRKGKKDGLRIIVEREFDHRRTEAVE